MPLTLTQPYSVPRKLGDNASLTSYDTVTVTRTTIDVAAGTVHMDLSLSASGDPSAEPITGSLTINTSTRRVTIAIPGFSVGALNLSVGQANTAAAWSSDYIQTVLDGLASVGVIAGS